jgi:hypothetical protein
MEEIRKSSAEHWAEMEKRSDERLLERLDKLPNQEPLKPGRPGKLFNETVDIDTSGEELRILDGADTQLARHLMERGPPTKPSPSHSPGQAYKPILLGGLIGLGVIATVVATAPAWNAWQAHSDCVNRRDIDYDKCLVVTSGNQSLCGALRRLREREGLCYVLPRK